jgi:hypothetical protein
MEHINTSMLVVARSVAAASTSYAWRVNRTVFPSAY